MRERDIIMWIGGRGRGKEKGREREGWIEMGGERKGGRETHRGRERGTYGEREGGRWREREGDGEREKEG